MLRLQNYTFPLKHANNSPLFYAKQYVYDIMDFMERQYLKDYAPLDLNKDMNWNDTYRTTAFDKATGWSKWMKANTGIPYNNPPSHN